MAVKIADAFEDHGHHHPLVPSLVFFI